MQVILIITIKLRLSKNISLDRILLVKIILIFL